MIVHVAVARKNRVPILSPALLMAAPSAGGPCHGLLAFSITCTVLSEPAAVLAAVTVGPTLAAVEDAQGKNLGSSILGENSEAQKAIQNDKGKGQAAPHNRPPCVARKGEPSQSDTCIVHPGQGLAFHRDLDDPQSADSGE
jgi:hypothetical protein